jgi:hypothetical protein
MRNLNEDFIHTSLAERGESGQGNLTATNPGDTAQERRAPPQLVARSGLKLAETVAGAPLSAADDKDVILDSSGVHFYVI